MRTSGAGQQRRQVNVVTGETELETPSRTSLSRFRRLYRAGECAPRI